MKQKKLTSLTDKDVRHALKNILGADTIDDITRYENNTIKAKISTTWEHTSNNRDESLKIQDTVKITETVTLTTDRIITGLSFTPERHGMWQRFLESRNIDCNTMTQ